VRQIRHTSPVRTSRSEGSQSVFYNVIILMEPAASVFSGHLCTAPSRFAATRETRWTDRAQMPSDKLRSWLKRRSSCQQSDGVSNNMTRPNDLKVSCQCVMLGRGPPVGYRAGCLTSDSGAIFRAEIAAIQALSSTFQRTSKATL
jgi:hypothetical protein